MSAKRAGTLESKDEKNHQDHMERKQSGRQEKQKDKEDAHKYNHIHTATFDIQAVLTTPCSLASQVYYKTKFQVTILLYIPLVMEKGLWNETEGQRGSCEIATCFHLYLNSLSPCTEQVTLFSDSCIGQNRNKFVASALLHAVCTSTYLEVVNYIFLEPEHTQMECDSMHSAMEYAKRKTNIYVPGYHCVYGKKKQPLSSHPC
jgi:hypothetical protein